MPEFNPPARYGITRVALKSKVTRDGFKCKAQKGWLVCISRRKQIVRKAFYDSGHGGSKGALAQAQAFRDQWLAAHPLLDAMAFSQQIAAHNTSGIPGVGRSVNPRNGSAYWGAFVSYRNKKIARTFSVNKYGEAVAKEKAIRARHALLHQFQAGNVRLYSPAAKALETQLRCTQRGTGNVAKQTVVPSARARGSFQFK
jgi:hypothetical protein